MKILIDNIDYKLLNKLVTNIEPFNKSNIIYTENGIFTHEDGIHYVLIPHDLPCKYVTYRNIDMILDNSTFEKREETFSISCDKYNVEIDELSYWLNDNVILVNRVINEEIIDTFFMCETLKELPLVHNVFDIIRDNHIECGIT